MKKVKMLLVSLCLSFAFCLNVFGAGFVIGVMQEKSGDYKKYEKLVDYCKSKGALVSIFPIKDYQSAAKLFEQGMISSMFSGSGVAACFMMKNIADPLVRPVSNDGFSTYWAVVLDKSGKSIKVLDAEYFKNKKVAFCGLASSGEFYFQSIPNAVKSVNKIKLAASHGEAIDMLDNGQVDIAIVKNRVWDKTKGKYTGISQVWRDSGENPDGTLIISKKVDKQIANKIEKILLDLKSDNSQGAKDLKDSLKATEFIKTTGDDFKTTISLLKSAGVGKAFNFEFMYGDKEMK